MKIGEGFARKDGCKVGEGLCETGSLKVTQRRLAVACLPFIYFFNAPFEVAKSGGECQGPPIRSASVWVSSLGFKGFGDDTPSAWGLGLRNPLKSLQEMGGRAHSLP